MLGRNNPLWGSWAWVKLESRAHLPLFNDTISCGLNMWRLARVGGSCGAVKMGDKGAKTGSKASSLTGPHYVSATAQ